MPTDKPYCYVYIQLPKTNVSIPCALLRIKNIAAGVFEGTFTYGKRYLERADVIALDQYRRALVLFTVG